jgi:hypothetical protein
MKRILQVGTLAFALLGGSGAALAIPLSALLDGGSITAGDKTFDQWSQIQYVATDSNRTFNAANIDVTALNDGGLEPGPGLQFTASNGELDVAGDGIFAFIDLAFSFRVTAPAGLVIHDISLAIDTGTVNNPSSDAGMTILEWAATSQVTDPGTPGYILAQISDPNVENAPSSASANVTPRVSYIISNDLLVWATDETESASLVAFTQRFSQRAAGTIPEPGTLALLALAAVAGVGARRRRT